MNRITLGAILCLVFFYTVGVATAQVVFEGNSEASEAMLRRALRYYNVSLEGGFDVTDADDAAFFLREFYFARGFPDAQVEYQFHSPPSSVVFTIDEGIRFWIGRMEFTGNTHISSQRLRDILAASIRQHTHSPFGRLRYVPMEFDSALRDLRSVFIEEGFLDVEISILEQPQEGNTIPLHIEISEGPQYHLTAVRLRESPYPPEKILQELKIELPQIYHPTDLTLIQNRLIQFFRNQGYVDVQVAVSVEKDAARGEVELTFGIDSGSIYTLSEVEVTGIQRTRVQAVMRKMNLPMDQPYDASRVEKGLQRLWSTGAFSEIEKKIDLSKSGKLRLSLQLEESRAKLVRIFLGYGQWEQAFARVSYVDRNFFGTLNRLEVNAHISMKGYTADATLYDPSFLNARLIGMVGGFASQREWPAYRATQYGGFAGVAQRKDMQHLTGYQLQYMWHAVTHSDVYGDQEDDGNYSVGGIYFRQIWDRRNSLLAPMSGFLLQHEIGVASKLLLGDLSFLRGSGQATFYLPLLSIRPERPLVPFFMFNSRVGWILPYAQTGRVPVQERFFLGGSGSVRSFSFDTLGPRDKYGNPLGGQAFFQQNIEFQIPVFHGLYLASFVDVGNLASEIDSIQWDQTAVGAGLGLRFYTPIGAIQLDYGYNVIRRPGYPIGAWQFGFGLNF